MSGIFTKCSYYKKWWRRRIEKGFFKLGYQVANSPWTTILLTLVLTFICGLGFLRFYNEKDLMELYVPKSNKFYQDTQWLMKQYGVFEREETVIIEAHDVLTPKVLKEALSVHNEIMNLKAKNASGSPVSFNDLCYSIPIITNLHLDEFDVDDTCDSVNQNPKQFCSVLTSLPRDCMQESLLEIFKFDQEAIPETKSAIIELLNNVHVSPYSGISKKFSDFLGDVVTDVNGTIIAAGSIISYYKIYGNYSEIDRKRLQEDSGLGSWASDSMLQWEKEFLQRMEKIHDKWNNTDIKIYYQAYRSYGDHAMKNAFQEVDKYIIGSVLMFVYMQLVLSKFGWVEIRIYLGSFGLFSVLMALVSGCGLCSFLGVPYGPVHAALPFLLLGLGVDDMFVMMACWRQLRGDILESPIQERIALMLQTAGASITITSVTDIMAFIVGGLAAMPILQSFCLYAAASILLMYIYVITFFLAIFTIDQKRAEQRKNGLIPCIVHTAEDSKLWCGKNLMHRFLKFTFSKCILTKLGKTLVIGLTIVLTIYNSMGLMELKLRFDPMHHVPADSYLSDFMHQVNKLYPDIGSEATVIIGRINYTQDMPKLINLAKQIENQSNIVHQVDAWPLDFMKFLDINYEKNITHLTDDEWKLYLYQFLNCHIGGKYNRYFKFESPMECGKPTSDVTVSQIGFKFKNLKDPEVYLPAKQTLVDLVARAELSSGEGYSSIWGKRLMMWIPDEIIKEEIFRNIALALIGVMICTAIIIANFNVCFWIFFTVILTLVNVAGSMLYIGLILDMVTYIALQLSIGLSVDYASHIGHMFLTIESGTLNDRALKTVLNIGEAVIYGGGSSFLALSILSVAKTYSYRAFFKVNALVILFGLYHGVVLLPVILSLVGPTEKQNRKESEMINIEKITKGKSKISVEDDDSCQKMINTKNGKLNSDSLPE